MSARIDLNGKVALVTGGSRGIGAACCRALAEAGAAVVVGYRSEAGAAEALCRELTVAGARALAVSADLARVKGPETLVRACEEGFGRLDALVNNAGIWKEAPLESMSDAEWRETLEVNLDGVFRLTRQALPLLRRSGGSIVTLTSTAGQRGEALHSHYAASKGALIAWTKSLAVELAPAVRVNSVAPGWVVTDMTHEALAEIGDELSASIPLGRPATPEEIAGPVLFLVSELAAHVTGEILNVNGGSVLCG
jgi:3-oxoacyl-[acyl-carrier protein] reductase